MACYFGLVIKTIACWLYKPIPIPINPTFDHKDITVILPTISTNVEELYQTVRSILDYDPVEILVITTKHQYKYLQELFKSMNTSNLKLLEALIANKRVQICAGIPLVTTRITISKPSFLI